MVITVDEAMQRQRVGAIKVVGCWVATAAVFCVNVLIVATPTGRWWPAGIALVTIMVGVMTAVVVTDVIDARRVAESRVDAGHRLGFLVAGGVWLLGGLFDLVFYLGFVHAEFCTSTAGPDDDRFECLHRPGPILDTIGVVTAILAAPALMAVIIFGRRSRVAAWLSPVLVASIYILAFFLWMPHVGLGVPKRLDQ